MAVVRRNKKTDKKYLIRKYGHFLEGLTHLPTKCRQKIISELPKEVINCVGECCLNIIKGNVPLTKAQKLKLRPRQKHLNLLAQRKVPIKEKKKLINQKGGAILGLLLKPLIGSIIGDVLGGLIPKR